MQLSLGGDQIASQHKSREFRLKLFPKFWPGFSSKLRYSYGKTTRPERETAHDRHYSHWTASHRCRARNPPPLYSDLYKPLRANISFPNYQPALVLRNSVTRVPETFFKILVGPPLGYFCEERSQLLENRARVR